jgi:hypothetical protein
MEIVRVKSIAAVKSATNGREYITLTVQTANEANGEEGIAFFAPVVASMNVWGSADQEWMERAGHKDLFDLAKADKLKGFPGTIITVPIEPREVMLADGTTVTRSTETVVVRYTGANLAQQTLDIEAAVARAKTQAIKQAV